MDSSHEHLWRTQVRKGTTFFLDCTVVINGKIMINCNEENGLPIRKCCWQASSICSCIITL